MEKGHRGNIPILLLAAGSSSRMGQSKQLLNIRGKTLLTRTVETCLSANTGEVIVVLGSKEKTHLSLIEKLPVKVVSNPRWSLGMGSSIKAGINYVKEFYPESAATIISVCDQPHLTAAHLNHLVDKFIQSKKAIIASSYDNTVGVPILFNQSLFKDLAQIKNTDGAKKLVKKYAASTAEVPFPLGAIDLDTIADYNTFNQQ